MWRRARLRLPNPNTDLEPLRLICEPASVASHAATGGYHPLPRRTRLQGTGWPSPRVNTRGCRSPKAFSGSSSRSIFRILARHVSTSLQDLSSRIEYNSVLSLLPRPLRTSRCVRESSSLCLERQRSFCSRRLRVAGRFEPMHHAPIATDPTSPSGGCESWSWQRVGALGLSCPGDQKVHITRR